MDAEKKLKRSSDKVFSGVCGGLAEYFGWEKSLVRILYFFLCIVTGFFPFGLLYILMMIIVPKD